MPKCQSVPTSSGVSTTMLPPAYGSPQAEESVLCWATPWKAWKQECDQVHLRQTELLSQIVCQIWFQPSFSQAMTRPMALCQWAFIIPSIWLANLDAVVQNKWLLSSNLLIEQKNNLLAKQTPGDEATGLDIYSRNMRPEDNDWWNTRISTLHIQQTQTAGQVVDLQLMQQEKNIAAVHHWHLWYGSLLAALPFCSGTGTCTYICTMT